MSRVRIVGGVWRSRLIPIASVPGLRPTPDRVRETLFNWLGQDMGGLNCLDLFAGTGILGFEAASRGAACSTLIEYHPRAVATLNASAQALNAVQVEIIRGDALKFIQSTPRKFDVVFLDPPYRQDWIARVAPWLDRVIESGGALYVEAEMPITNLGRWQVVKHGHAGQVYFHLLRERQE